MAGHKERIMAITKNTMQVTGYGFAVNATSTDVSGTEELVAAPGEGKYIHVTRIVVITASAITVTIGAGETGGAVSAVLLGPSIAFTAAIVPWVTEFNPAVLLAENTALVVDADGSGAVNIFVQGYIQ